MGAALLDAFIVLPISDLGILSSDDDTVEPLLISLAGLATMATLPAKLSAEWPELMTRSRLDNLESHEKQ